MIYYCNEYDPKNQVNEFNEKMSTYFYSGFNNNDDEQSILKKRLELIRKGTLLPNGDFILNLKKYCNRFIPRFIPQDINSGFNVFIKPNAPKGCYIIHIKLYSFIIKYYFQHIDFYFNSMLDIRNFLGKSYCSKDLSIGEDIDINEVLDKFYNFEIEYDLNKELEGAFLENSEFLI